MIRVAATGAGFDSGLLAPGYEEPLRIHPPRVGLRPGTAAGDPQTPF